MIKFNTDAKLTDWLPVCSLGFAAFVFVTTELMPIGLLPDIAASINKTEAFTGLLVTFYAWSVALVSLPLTILTEKMDRRKLLFWIFGIFIVSHILAANANSFVTLLAARICIAFAHAVFWSIATPLATRLAPHGKKPQALAIVATGISLATVLGVPIGTIMGHQFGWRFTFAVVGGVALLVILALWRMLPLLPSQNTNNMAALPTMFKRRTLLKIYLLTFLAVTAHFTAFSYLRPIFEQITRLSADGSAVLLLILGLSGIIGSVIASRYAESYPRALFFIALLTMGTCLAILRVAAEILPLLVVVCAIWGATMSAIGVTFQTVIFRVASDIADMSISIYSSTFNAGIGGGAFIGSMVFSQLGLSYIGYAGAIFALAAFLLLFTLTELRAPKAKNKTSA